MRLLEHSQTALTLLFRDTKFTVRSIEMFPDPGDITVEELEELNIPSYIAKQDYFRAFMNDCKVIGLDLKETYRVLAQNRMLMTEHIRKATMIPKGDVIPMWDVISFDTVLDSMGEFVHNFMESLSRLESRMNQIDERQAQIHDKVHSLDDKVDALGLQYASGHNEVVSLLLSSNNKI